MARADQRGRLGTARIPRVRITQCVRRDVGAAVRRRSRLPIQLFRISISSTGKMAGRARLVEVAMENTARLGVSRIKRWRFYGFPRLLVFPVGLDKAAFFKVRYKRGLQRSI